MGDHRPYGPQSGTSSGRETVQWHELRELLTGPEQRQLARILQRLDDPVMRARELTRLLPDAISLAGPENRRMVRALQPIIDTAMQQSARRNPKAIADAIFPTLGPAIRKAISATLMGMVQSLNHILNQSFSLRGIRWRIEALRSRKSFAEVVLLHTLVYRVEQIYLIHRHSGLLLQHAETGLTENKDPDLVSGMLTAIQDFVRDSFDTDTGQILDTLRMDGDHSVWIEYGADALIAVVVRGTPPVDLRERFRQLLDEIHDRFGPTLKVFSGDTTPFALVRPDLEDAMVFQVQQHKQAVSPLLWVLAAAVLAISAGWGWQTYDTHRHWQHLLAQLREARGIVITRAEKQDGIYQVDGLRDYQARDVDALVMESGLDPRRVVFHWEPFLALDPVSIQARAREMLKPPQGVRLALRDGVLVVTGKAPHGWIRSLLRQVPIIVGIRGYDATRLQDEEMQRLTSLMEDLRGRSLRFDRGAYLLDEEQQSTLTDIIGVIRDAQALGRSVEKAIKLRIIGQTDASGTRAFNLDLSRRRALAVRNALIQQGIDAIGLEAIGTGTAAPADAGRNKGDSEAFRTVRFAPYLESQ